MSAAIFFDKAYSQANDAYSSSADSSKQGEKSEDCLGGQCNEGRLGDDRGEAKAVVEWCWFWMKLLSVLAFAFA
jgi:hypothetical protein